MPQSSSIFDLGYPRRRPLHEQRKLVAEAAIDIVLTSVERGAWRYDDWVRNCLVYSVNNLHHGRYDLAKEDALQAATPLAERSSEPVPPVLDVTIEQLRQAFMQVQASRALEFPTF